MEQTGQKRTAKILLSTVLTFVVTLAMVFAILPQATLTAYAAGGTEVTQANVICQQYSYMDAGDYSGGSMYDTPPVEITNITLADAQAFGAAVTCPTTYWVVVYAKDGNNLKWTSNGKTGEQTSTPNSSMSAWCELYNNDVFSLGDPYSNVTFYFSKGLATPAETLLTTITATGQEQASYSVENIATVSFSYTAQGSSAYYNNGKTNWGWWGYGWIATVSPVDGYTITKCVFYDDKDRTATDSEAPFVVETTEEDKTPQVNGTPILAYQSKGITKIEVYGYATLVKKDVTSISLNKNTTTILIGNNETLTATVSPNDATYKTVVWLSDNTNVAEVDSNGKITAKSVGSANITARATNGTDDTSDDFTATCVVTVNAINVTGVNLNKNTTTILVGNNETLTATISPNNATYKTLIWSSNNTNVAEVNSNGKVTAKSAGTAIITARATNGTDDTSDDFTASCVVTVHAHNYTVTVNGSTATVKCSNDCPDYKEYTVSLNATDKDYDGTTNVATITKSNDLPNTILVGTINYVGRDGTTYNSTTAPTNVGKYSASVTVGDKTITKNFEIKALAPVSFISSVTYNPSKNTVTIVVTTIRQYIILTSTTKIWQNNYYVAKNNVTINGPVYYGANVSLILFDDVTLLIRGGLKRFGSELTIYGQEGQDGLLQIEGSDNDYVIDGDNITVNGGQINLVTGTNGTLFSNDSSITFNSALNLTATNSQGDELVLESGKTYTGSELNSYNSFETTTKLATLTDVSVYQTGNLTYNGEPQTAEVSASATAQNEKQVVFTYSATENGTYSTEIPAFTNAGNHTVYYKANAENHEETTGSFEVVIGKATYDMSGVTFANATYTYDGDPKSLAISGTLPEGVTVSYSGNGQTNASLTAYVVTASFTGDAYNYNAIPDMTANLKIKKANCVLTAPTGISGLVYTGEAQALVTAGEVVGGTIWYTLDLEYYSTDIPTGINVKRYSICYKVIGDENHNDINKQYVDDVVIIAPATLTDVNVAQSGTLTYSGEPQTANVTTSATSVNNQTVTFTYSTEEEGEFTATVPAFTTAGTHTVYFEATAPNHNKVTGSFEVVIGKATYDMSGVTFEDAQFTYDGTPKSLAISGTLPEGVSVEYTGNAQTNVSATAYVVTATFTGDADNYYAIPDMTANLTINKADITFTAPLVIENLVYTGNTQALVAAGTAEGGEMQYALGENATTAPADNLYATSIPTATNAGTYYVWYKIAGDENHNDTEPACVEVTINKADPTYAIPSGLTATYGDTLADVALPTGWAWADNTASVGNAGTNTFKANFTPADTANYNTVNNVDVTVSVVKADPTYTIPSGLTATYGDTLSSVTLPEGWTWNEPTTSVGTVGSHTFAAIFTPDNTDNYNTVKENLTITVNANDKSALIAAIGSASEYYNSISSEHPDIATTLQNAIDVATSVKNDDNKTEAEISDAVTALNSALDQAKADENQAKASIVKALIAAIGTVEYTTESKGKIDEARAAYNGLTADQKALVDTYETLTTAETTYATEKKTEEDNAAANAVKEKIAAIGTVEYTTESKDKIDEAKAAYDALTADQKALVDTYETLTTAESTYNTLKANNEAADEVKALIDSIGTVELTVNSKAVIDLARESYDGLTTDQKALVSNYDVLTAAEVRYADLGAADEVKTLVDAIGDVTYSTESKDKIDAAREAYDALTADQKALVTNYGTLTSAEGNYTDLKAVKEAEDAVSVLPASDDITVTDKAAVAAAKAKYDALTPAQKATVSAETVAKLSAASNMVAAQEVVFSIGNIDADNPDSAKVTEARAAYDALTDEQKAKVTNYESLTAAESKLAELNNKGLGAGFIVLMVMLCVIVAACIVLLVLYTLDKNGKLKRKDE